MTDRLTGTLTKEKLVGQPKYAALANRLRSQIARGEIKAGEPFPSQTQLTRQYGVALTTVRQALGVLRQEGMVEAIQGKGAFVVGTTPRSPHGRGGGAIAAVGFLTVGATVYDPLYHLMVEGAEGAIRGTDLRLVYGSVQAGQDDPIEPLRQWSQGLAGVIAVGAISRDIIDVLQTNVQHVVLIGELNSGVIASAFSKITIDFRSTGLLATNYLASLGHRRFRFLNRGGTEFCEELEKGLIAASQRMNMGIDICHGETQDDESAFVDRFVRSGERPSAILTLGVQRGHRLVSLLRDVSVNVPGDVSLLAVGSKKLTDELIPRITCIDHSETSLGQLAMQAMRRFLQEGQTTYQEVVGEIVLGDTCAATFQRA